jgi:transposase-like protein
MSQRKVRDARDARACLAAAAKSGMARPAWAAAHGVDPRSLNAWRINLGRAARSTAPSPVSLVEYVPTALPAESARYRVLCGALAVEVDAAFDAEVLRRLLAVVASC